MQPFRPNGPKGTIVRRNGIRTLTISVDNEAGVMASDIFNEIKPQIESLNLPDGVSIDYGGDYEGNVEIFLMTIALGLSIVIIFFILLFSLKK